MLTRVNNNCNNAMQEVLGKYTAGGGSKNGIKPYTNNSILLITCNEMPYSLCNSLGEFPIGIVKKECKVMEQIPQKFSTKKIDISETLNKTLMQLSSGEKWGQQFTQQKTYKRDFININNSETWSIYLLGLDLQGKSLPPVEAKDIVSYTQQENDRNYWGHIKSDCEAIKKKVEKEYINVQPSTIAGASVQSVDTQKTI